MGFLGFQRGGSSKRRINCPVCGRSVSVSGQGKIMPHTADGKANSGPCAGVGMDAGIW